MCKKGRNFVINLGKGSVGRSERAGLPLLLASSSSSAIEGGGSKFRGGGNISFCGAPKIDISSRVMFTSEANISHFRAKEGEARRRDSEDVFGDLHSSLIFSHINQHFVKCHGDLPRYGRVWKVAFQFTAAGNAGIGSSDKEVHKLCTVISSIHFLRSKTCEKK